MHKFENEIVSSTQIAKEFRLGEALARDIVTEETRKALLRQWQTWLVIVCGLSVAGYLYFSTNGNSTSSVLVLVFTASCWLLIGRYFARTAIRTAARQKSERIHGSHT